MSESSRAPSSVDWQSLIKLLTPLWKVRFLAAYHLIENNTLFILKPVSEHARAIESLVGWDGRSPFLPFFSQLS